MKKIVCLVAVITLAVMSLYGKDYQYATVAGDITATRIYTLDNGLKVYMSVNKEKPRISALIAVGTGSRNDPAETTGLAHYFEHLMFKGSTHFGTTDYAAEKPLLDKIEALFEQYRKESDDAKRKSIYHEIDSVSQLAAKYNIPNEYDKLMAAIGAQGTNAYTSNDVTCYTEDIPSNEVENWARVQSDRFMNMVIRGFHTELETVYEEKNISMGKDQWKMYDALYAKLYPTHPYGTQTTIGTQEHLKNPSITNIKNYKDLYYVPNNVAICLAGDLNPDEVMPIIDKYFGPWQPIAKVNRPEYAPLAPITAPSDTTVYGQEAAFTVMAWRLGAGASAQCDTLEVVTSMLTNSTAGILDLNINQPMKAQYCYAFADILNDYSSLVVLGMPNQGQTLNEVRGLITGEMAKLASGDFDESLIKAVVNNMKLQFMRDMEQNRKRTDMMVDAYINGKTWEDVVSKMQRLEGITKEQIMAFASRHLRDNYVVVNKEQGEDTTIKKIDKPAITPIPSNRDYQSDFVADLLKRQPQPIQPQWVDYSADLSFGEVRKGIPVIYKQNTENDLFTLAYKYDFGQSADNAYDVALYYLDYLGTNKMSAEEFKKAMYGLACSVSFSCGNEEMTVTISGLSQNMKQAVALVEQLLNNAKPDKAAYDNLVESILKSRLDAKNNQQECNARLREFGIYGPRNRYTDQMSEKQLRTTKPKDLVERVKQLATYQHTVLYYGPMSMDELNKTMREVHVVKGDLALRGLRNHPYMAQLTPENEVLLAPYDAKNIYMTQYCNNGRKWEPQNTATISLFNEYFGANMNSIVFQEIREARGMAYNATAYYSRPSYMGRTEYATTFVITQNDKMMDCINQFKCIIDTLPESEKAFNLAKESLIKQMASRRVTKMGVINNYLSAQRLGLDYDQAESIYKALPSMTFGDIAAYERDNMVGKTWRYLILGNEAELDMESLARVGAIKRVSLEEIFGY